MGGAPPSPHSPPPPPTVPRMVIVSATVPGQGQSSVGAFLDRRFPRMKWLRSAGAHRPVASLRSAFETVDTQAEREAALVRLCEARRGRTLVFANSAPRADEAFKLLRRANLVPDGASAFHPNVPVAQREALLAKFASSADGVLVCSGLGARGIDLPDVQLVIEYQLAPNVVEHVHRVGRTARAGKAGEAISLVNEGSDNEAALVAEVERCNLGGWKYV